MFNTILENGIVISLFLGLAYLFTYQYQKSKLSYYGIPLIYVDLSIGSIVETSLLIISILYFACILLRPLSDNFKDVKNYHSMRIMNATIWFVIMFSMIFTVTNTFNVANITLIIVYLLYVAYNLLVPIISIKEKVSYSKKWSKYSKVIQEKETKEETEQDQGYYAGVKAKIFNIALLVSVIMVLCAAFRMAATDKVKTATTFYIANNYNDKIIVHCTTDYYVLMELENNKLLHTYQIVPSNEIGTITMKEIGPLLITDIKDKNEKTLSDMYASTKNADNTYSYAFSDLNDNILFQKESIVREPKINQIGINIYELKTQTGTGLSTNWAVYCDVKKSKTSETFYYVLTAQGDYVVCADYKDSKHFITVQNIFDKSAYHKTYELENVSPVASDFALGCEFDGDNNAIITYLTGEDYTETKITIDIP